VLNKHIHEDIADNTTQQHGKAYCTIYINYQPWSQNTNLKSWLM